MAPREYSMQRRAEQVARTRDRIVDAATEVFAERGAGGTTMTEVARAADVATATVTNHFATPELLLQAVVDSLMTQIQIPDDTIFIGARSASARLRALTAAMFAFYERTTRWWTLLGAEITDVPVLAKADADFRRAVQGLYTQALTGVEDEVVGKAVAGLVHPATYTALRQAGLSMADATDVVAEALGQRARRRPRNTGTVDPRGRGGAQ
jgi:AcrR family transcriptional regulator